MPLQLPVYNISVSECTYTLRAFCSNVSVYGREARANRIFKVEVVKRVCGVVRVRAALYQKPVVN